MRLSRNRFFLYLFILLVLPLPLYKLIWILSSRKTEGTMYFTGHGNLGSVLGITTYPVIWFKSGKDTIYFNGNLNIPLREGEKVSVLYQRNDPGDAKIRLFSCLWGDTMAYDLAPFIILLIVFFHPDLIPKKSTILIGRGGKIKIE